MTIFLVPLVIGGPPAILNFARLFPIVDEWLKQHPYIQATLAGWMIFPLFGSYLYHKFKPTPVGIRYLTTVYEVLGRVVGTKINNLANVLEELKRAKGRSKHVLAKIIRTDSQISEIVKGVHEVFCEVNGNDDAKIRVALARMGEMHIERFQSFYPPDWTPRSTPESLRKPESGFSRAKSLRKIIVVPDSRKEADKGPDAQFVVSRRDLRDEECSMICYPVTEPNSQRIPFVISICARKADVFKVAEEDVYKELLEPFAQRIALEYLLSEINSLTNSKIP